MVMAGGVLHGARQQHCLLFIGSGILQHDQMDNNHLVVYSQFTAMQI